jgi:hypothetical protein
LFAIFQAQVTTLFDWEMPDVLKIKVLAVVQAKQTD